MSLYPTLEDMQVDKMLQAQHGAFQQQQQQQQQQPSLQTYNYKENPYHQLSSMSVGTGAAAATTTLETSNSSNAIMYPDLGDFMGLELTQQMIAENMPEYLAKNNQQAAVATAQSMAVSATGLSGMVAPLSGTSVGLKRAHVTNGIRELILCKGKDNKVGLRVKDINKGVFVSVVVKDSPAAVAGLRFGDQILQINGQLVAGYSMDDLHKLIKKSPVNGISVCVRDRPFERAITMHKDSAGRCGFQFNNGKISAIVKDSSAARNGVLIDHQILEINGQNVVGLKDKELTKLIETGGQMITITIIPTFIYDHMMTKLTTSFIRGKMDHSVPDF